MYVTGMLGFLRFPHSSPFLRSCGMLEPINKTERVTDHLEEISRKMEPDRIEELNRFRRFKNSDDRWIQQKEECKNDII